MRRLYARMQLSRHLKLRESFAARQREREEAEGSQASQRLTSEAAERELATRRAEAAEEEFCTRASEELELAFARDVAVERDEAMSEELIAVRAAQLASEESTILATMLRSQTTYLPSSGGNPPNPLWVGGGPLLPFWGGEKGAFPMGRVRGGCKQKGPMSRWRLSTFHRIRIFDGRRLQAHAERTRRG